MDVASARSSQGQGRWRWKWRSNILIDLKYLSCRFQTDKVVQMNMKVNDKVEPAEKNKFADFKSISRKSKQEDHDGTWSLMWPNGYACTKWWCLLLNNAPYQI